MAMDEVEKKIKSAKSRPTDYSGTFLSMAGIVGLIVGCLAIFYPKLFNANTYTVFHEVHYDPHKLIDPVIAEKLLLSKIRYNQIRKEYIDLKLNKRETDFEKSRLDSAVSVYSSYLKFAMANAGYGYYDTTSFDLLTKVIHPYISPNMLYSWNYDYVKNKKRFFDFTYSIREQSFPANEVQILNSKFETIKHKNDLAFLTKYPAFGLWILCVMSLISVCFISIFVSLDISDKLDYIEKAKSPNYQGRFLTTSFLVFCLLCLLLFIWYLTFADSTVVPELLFMKNIDATLWIVLLIGYVAGSFSIAGFIQCAIILSGIADVYNSARMSLKAEVPKQEEVIKFKLLLGYFNRFFLTIAMVLSVMVFTNGALYSAINSMDFVKLISKDWGYSPLRMDFVYLFGMLNTLIMLIVYIPAKSKFDYYESVFISEAVKKSVAPFDIFKIPIASLKNLLVVTSPFLASLLNLFFELFTK